MPAEGRPVTWPQAGEDLAHAGGNAHPQQQTASRATVTAREAAAKHALQLVIKVRQAIIALIMLRQLRSVSRLYVPIGQQHSLWKPASADAPRGGSSATWRCDMAHASACNGAALATAVGISVLSAIETETSLRTDAVRERLFSSHAGPAHRGPHALGTAPWRTLIAGAASLDRRSRHMAEKGRPCEGAEQRFLSADARRRGFASAEEPEGLSIFWMHRLPMYRTRMHEICHVITAGAELDGYPADTLYKASAHAGGSFAQIHNDVAPSMQPQRAYIVQHGTNEQLGESPIAAASRPHSLIGSLLQLFQLAASILVKVSPCPSAHGFISACPSIFWPRLLLALLWDEDAALAVKWLSVITHSHAAWAWLQSTRH